MLAALAAVLVVVGLVLATTAPAGPSANNKVDAYGGPVPQKPTNPKNRAACDKFYSAANKLAEAQGCRATAALERPGLLGAAQKRDRTTMPGIRGI